MRHSVFLTGSLVAASAVWSAAAPGQAPDRKLPPVPQVEMRDPKACAAAPATIDKGGEVAVRKPGDATLSEQLAKSDGVICPPPAVDPGIRAPAPDVGTLPVIPPPGTNDPTIRPK